MSQVQRGSCTVEQLVDESRARPRGTEQCWKNCERVRGANRSAQGMLLFHLSHRVLFEGQFLRHG